jgi:hypothetical protein
MGCRCFCKPNGTIKPVVVAQTHSCQAQSGGSFDKLFWRRNTIEKAKTAVCVKFCIRHTFLGGMMRCRYSIRVPVGRPCGGVAAIGALRDRATGSGGIAKKLFVL